ncbi:sigma 54-interacting transcriptional regulator [Desulfatiferula olefinivorans]
MNDQNHGYQTFFETEDAAVMVIDEDMTILRINENLERISGFRKFEMEGRLRFTDYVHPEDLPRMVRYHAKRRTCGKDVPATYACRLIHKDGRIGEYMLDVSLIPHTGRTMVSFRDSLVRPVTEPGKTTEAQMFRLMAENTTDQVFIANLDVQITYVSPSVRNMSGYTQEEFKLLTPREYFAPASYEKAKRKVRMGLEGRYDVRQPFLAEYQIIHKNGSMKWVETLVQFILDEEGRPVCITGASRDITRKKQAEDALKASEAKYRQLTEEIRDVVLVVLPDSTIDYISPVIRELGGYDPAEMIGKPMKDYFVDPREYGRALFLFGEILRSRKPTTNHEFLFKSKDGDPFYVEVTAKPVVRDHEVVMIQCVGRDITDRKKEEEKLKKREKSLSLENLNLRKSIHQCGQFCGIIGKCKAMMDVYDLLLMAAPTNLSTIIYGESGTGKELIARAVHTLSNRNAGRFVPVNCGAITENIIESEFFGYKKGAFTGAVQDRGGFLDLADGGTLFLDEIGEIGLNMQVKLLRAIEGGGYTPVGSNQLKKTDIRIVAATNKDLADLVKQGKMRADFFYRINIIRIDLPPLRERKEDIPGLVDHFLRKSPNNVDVTRLPDDVMSYLDGYHFPGNVRELQNIVNQYIALRRIVPAPFGSSDVRTETRELSADERSDSLASLVNDYEKKIIGACLSECNWNKSRVAKRLGIDRKTLSTKIRKLDLEQIPS